MAVTFHARAFAGCLFSAIYWFVVVLFLLHVLVIKLILKEKHKQQRLESRL